MLYKYFTIFYRLSLLAWRLIYSSTWLYHSLLSLRFRCDLCLLICFLSPESEHLLLKIVALRIHSIPSVIVASISRSSLRSIDQQLISSHSILMMLVKMFDDLWIYSFYQGSYYYFTIMDMNILPRSSKCLSHRV